jgi:hypothetical protein
MAIPYQVSYTKTGNKKTRNVLTVICPTVFNQELGFRKVKPLFEWVGDKHVDWSDTSAGFENLLNKGEL